MSSNKPSVSLKSSIIAAILLVSFLSLFLSVFFTTYVNEKNKEQEARNFIDAISEIIAFNAQIPLSFDQREGIQEFLDTLEHTKEISNIHVYRIDEYTEQLQFFASYNQRHHPPVRAQFSRVPQLTTPVLSELDNSLELAKAVVTPNSSETIGYVYIKIDMAKYQTQFDDLVVYYAIMLGVVFAIAYLTSRLIQRRALSPINLFVQELRKITESKDFETRIDSPELLEMQILAESVNAMLTKINQQIHQFSLAEKEIKELNQSLEEKVVSRTQALRDSNQELLDALEQVHQYQSQVIQSEKMASLGQMVAGVAHEVNTPIGLGVTASTMLSDKIDIIVKALEDKTLSAKKLDRFLAESKENTQIIYRNLSRAADLISSFKQVAVDQTADTIRKIKVKEFLSEVLMSMNPTLKKSSQDILIHCDETLSIITKPGPINQIMMNLIMNSVLHAFREDERGSIEITVWQQGDNCFIRYQDNGCGIEEKIKQKIFDPFVTTRRGEGGSGLGMHLVYNLVTQALKGQISVTSELGNGAQFDIEFPAHLQEGSND